MRFPLSSFEIAWTEAAFDAVYPAPPRSRLPHGILSMKPAPFLEDMLSSVPLEQSLGIRLTLWMVALAPLVTIRKLGTIASIDVDDRRLVLELLLASRVYAVRQLALSLKAVATLLYAKSEAVRLAMTTPVRSVAADEGALARAPSGLISAARLASRVAAAERHPHTTTTTLAIVEENDHAAA
jgi:hypothetical protein